MILLPLAFLLAQAPPCETTQPRATFVIPHVQGAPRLETDAEASVWKSAASAWIVKDCTRELDYPALKSKVRAFWTDSDLYLLFACPYRDLNVFLPAQNDRPRNKLWDRDVVEVFLGGDWKNIRQYREFEIAPTGDWIDLAIDLDETNQDDSWRSGWQTAARIDEKARVWYAAAKIPLKSVSTATVQPGTRWRANLYRIEGKGPDSERRFLCWQPTCAPGRDPNHVPEHFGTLVFAPPPAAQADLGKKRFETLCAACHGADGMGGERAPSLLHSAAVKSGQELRRVVRNGIPAAGMPAFNNLPKREFEEVISFVRSLSAPAAESTVAGDASAGREFFFGAGKCATCHIAEGRGGWLGPDLSDVARRRTLPEIERALRSGSPPSNGYQGVEVKTREGHRIRGVARNESNHDLQVLGTDGRFYLLRADEIVEIVRDPKSLMPPLEATAGQRQDLLAYLSRLKESSVGQGHPETAQTGSAQFASGDWPTYHGHPGGNRYSALRQINTGNVVSLAARWVFPVNSSQRLEVTPVVVDGVMYVTTVNEAWALDARTGRQLWHYSRPRTKGVIGDAAGGINRGVAVHGDRVFLVTDDAHLLALHRLNGALLWDVEMADYRQHYGATSAPLVVNDLVISGTSGGDEGVRGFVVAYKAGSGERVWRFWTIPAPGEPLSETWAGKALKHGCATAWLTGTYDPAAGLLYWPTGNPCPDYNGDERQGDNLYSDSVLALRADTGKLAWYYQFTPHDLHDWDAEQVPLLVDAEFRGRSRKLLVQANRNGFLYVLDRTNGELLLARPFVKNLSWASGIGADGRPKVLPNTDPTIEGVKVCPAVEGATNWMSAAFSPDTGLFYVQALEKCSIYTKSSAWWEPGKSFYGGATRDVPGEPGRKYLRALDLRTGEIVWEFPQAGPAKSWGGVLATAGGLVFFCDDSGAFAAVEARSGKPLWSFHTNQLWKASPMTYMAAGRQYVAVAAGTNILAFGLP